MFDHFWNEKNLAYMSFQGHLWYPHHRLHHIKTPSNTPKYKNDIYTSIFGIKYKRTSFSRIDFRTYFAKWCTTTYHSVPNTSSGSKLKSRTVWDLGHKNSQISDRTNIWKSRTNSDQTDVAWDYLSAPSGQTLSQKWFKIQFWVFQQRMMESESVFSVSISWPETFFCNENNSFSISQIFFSRFFVFRNYFLEWTWPQDYVTLRSATFPICKF